MRGRALVLAVLALTALAIPAAADVPPYDHENSDGLIFPDPPLLGTAEATSSANRVTGFVSAQAKATQESVVTVPFAGLVPFNHAQAWGEVGRTFEVAAGHHLLDVDFAGVQATRQATERTTNVVFVYEGVARTIVRVDALFTCLTGCPAESQPMPAVGNPENLHPQGSFRMPFTIDVPTGQTGRVDVVVRFTADAYATGVAVGQAHLRGTVDGISLVAA